MMELPYDLGDYILDQVLDSKGNRVVYQARQTGTDRQVMLEVLEEEKVGKEEVDAFLSELKAKTKLSELVTFAGVVYEAQQKDGYLFFTYQEAPGDSLEIIAERQKTLRAKEILSILKVICQLEKILEQEGIASERIDSRKVFISDLNEVGIANLAIEGERDKTNGERDMRDVAKTLLPFITFGTPGATRLNTLFQWMEQGVEDRLLTWQEVEDLVLSVEEQLGLVNTQSLDDASNSRSRKMKLAAYFFVLILCALGVLGWFMYNGGEDAPEEKEREAPVFSGGSHTDVAVGLPDDPEELYCDAHEVTIKAYARFLDFIEKMPPETRMKQYAHDSQPIGKINYVPDHWPEIMNAVQSGEKWNGMDVSLNSPVFNVDWWDACAYAAWAGRRLPTKEEWLVAAQIASVTGNGDAYGAVESYRKDHGARHLCGFLSGVSEWTSTVEKKEDEPMLPPQHVICGGNYSIPGIIVGYVKSPDVRNETTGFRTVKAQQKD